MRQAAEQDLETTSNRLRVVLDESTLGIALVDRAGHPVEVNPALARMLGYSVEELRAMRFTQFTHPDDADLDWQLFAELVRGERSHYRVENRYLRKDGHVLWGRLTVSAARDEQGNPLILLGMVEDLTEHREVQTLQTRLRVLEGMLPICMFCKGIRNEDDGWEQLEN